jgi:hypothetical protein
MKSKNSFSDFLCEVIHNHIVKPHRSHWSRPLSAALIIFPRASSYRLWKKMGPALISAYIISPGDTGLINCAFGGKISI